MICLFFATIVRAAILENEYTPYNQSDCGMLQEENDSINQLLCFDDEMRTGKSLGSQHDMNIQQHMLISRQFSPDTGDVTQQVGQGCPTEKAKEKERDKLPSQMNALAQRERESLGYSFTY